MTGKASGTVFGVILLLFLVTVGVRAQDLHTVSFSSVEVTCDYFTWRQDHHPLISAHRGGPMPGYPENCLETFQRNLQEAPCIIECDVRLTRDSVLVMMHDESVDRTTNGTGLVGDLTFSEVKSLFLKDNKGTLTSFSVPTFGQVLEWAKGRAILTVDVKRPVSEKAIVDAIVAHDAVACAVIITYTIESARTYHQLLPEAMLSVTIRNRDEWNRFRETGIPSRQILAFVGVHEPSASLYDLLHENGISTILGTMGNLDTRALKKGIEVYRQLYLNGADILSTDETVLVADAIKTMKTPEKKEIIPDGAEN